MTVSELKEYLSKFNDDEKITFYFLKNDTLISRLPINASSESFLINTHFFKFLEDFLINVCHVFLSSSIFNAYQKLIFENLPE